MEVVSILLLLGFSIVMLAFILKSIEVKPEDHRDLRQPYPANNQREVPNKCESSSKELHKFNVKYVIDGDTVIVSSFWSEIRIRLYAIDCPEDGQPWGDVATAGLIKMIGGREVLLETYGVDKHGRTLATIFMWQNSKLINVNERMVMLGHAWYMRKFCHELSVERQAQLERLEKWARFKRVGLWKTNDPIPPWLWRKPEFNRFRQ